MSARSASLYIHIPFCSSFCDYCDFYSVNRNSINDDYIDSFLSALINSIKYQIEYFNVERIPTAYIGGGTPSVIGEKIRLLFDFLKSIPSFSPVEFTIEANPESLTERFLEECIEGGVNRLSLGVQTFHEPSRLAVNRQSGSRLNERLTLASRYFPPDKEDKTLSIDMVTGLPCHNEKIILEDIKRVLSFTPSHISLYSLTVEENTALKEKIKNKTVSLPDVDFSDRLWLSGKDALIKAGYEHYEISNFARKGKRCLHNIRYWQLQNWLGAGPSSSGTIINDNEGCAERYTFAPNTDMFSEQFNKRQKRENNEQLSIHNKNIYDYEKIEKNVLLKESLLMGFRYTGGPNSFLFRQRFGRAIEDYIPQTLKKWENKDKTLFLNSFLNDAFEEIENEK